MSAVSDDRYRKRTGPSGGRARSKTPKKMVVYRFNPRYEPIRGSKTERKFVDVSSLETPGTGATTFSTPVLLNGIGEGTSATTRIGRKIVMKSLLLRYIWSLGATSIRGAACRVKIVYDRQANTAAPAVTDILLANNVLSPNNISNNERFVTLVDFFTDPVSIENNFQVCGEVYRKINLPTRFDDGTGATIADVTTGSVYMMVAQTGGVATESPVFTYRSRIRYEDI